MDLTIDELDSITEIQHNRPEHELDAANAWSAWLGNT
jgi:hypothetical protein